MESQLDDISFVTPEIRRQVDELYDMMTVEERLAQLQCCYMHKLFGEDKHLDTAKCRELIPYGIGHIPQYATNNTESPEVMRSMMMELQQWLMENTPSGIPALFHEEVLTGFCAKGATIYPQQIGQACSFNTELAVLKAQQTAVTMRQTGGMLSLSPMVDVVKVPSFNRLEESYGEDAYLSAALGCAFVKGLQSGGFRTGVMTTSKHFLGYGGGGDAGEQELYEEILLPHEAMIRTGGSHSVMMGYHYVNDTLCTVNHYLMRHILRDYLGFDGMIVSDYGAMNNPDCGEDVRMRAMNAMNAGMEVEFPNIGNYAVLPELMAEGLVRESDFEQAVKHVMEVKAALGLLDDEPVLYTGSGEIVYDSPEERQTAYDIACQSVVLLKNNGVLPLAGTEKIALVGPNANSMWAMLGDYAYPAMKMFWHNHDVGNANGQIVTLKAGMESRLPKGASMEYSMGCDWVEKTSINLNSGGDARAKSLKSERRIETEDEIDFDKALAVASGSDVIVAAMGENVFLCGENRDRGSLRLPGKQEEFVRALIGTGKPVVLVLFGGRALVVGDLMDKCAAVVQAWYPGEEGGNAVADILYGNVNPSAKLSVCYPEIEIDGAVCYNTGLDYDEQTGLYDDGRIRFPFGYGLSYSSYEYSDLTVVNEGDVVSLSFNVKNTGEVSGDEIVQLYLSSDNPAFRPIKLIGFSRVSLSAGEIKRVNARVSVQQFGYYADGQWNVVSGDFTLKVGASSQDIRLKVGVTLELDCIAMPLRTIYFSEIF